MKASEIREKTFEELSKDLQELKSDLYTLRFQQALSNLANPMEIKKVRKAIARVLTIMRELELKASQK